MFGDVNEVRIMGNITQDLEVRRTASGTAVTSFGVATNRRYRVRDEEEWREEVEFHNVVVWARQAESLAQRAHKGTRLYIEGRLQTRSWEGDDGTKRYRTEIVARRIILIDRFERGPSDELDEVEFSDNAPAPQEPPETAKKTDKKAAKGKDTTKSKSKTSESDDEIDPDDLPF